MADANTSKDIDGGDDKCATVCKMIPVIIKGNDKKASRGRHSVVCLNLGTAW